MTTQSPSYLVELPGLADAVEKTAPNAKHTALIQSLQRFQPIQSARMTAVRGQDGGTYLVKRKVLDAQGNIVSLDHQAWLNEQLQADGGDAGTTYERLKTQGYILSRCLITSLYFAHDRGGADESNFLQVEVVQEDEFAYQELFTAWPWHNPRNLRDLLDMLGSDLDEKDRKRIRPSVYRLQRVIDVQEFVTLAESLEKESRDQFRKKRFAMRIQDGLGGESIERVVSADNAFPGWDAVPIKWGRMFRDWAASSAGRSGARLCEHWAIQANDQTDQNGKRWMSLVPMWAFAKKLAKVEGHKGNASEYALYGKLQALDTRVGVPWAWFFFMLHGNRVNDSAAYRVLKAAEDGLIVLPEHDYRVLKAWGAHPYGF